jgi:hypothetical protein
MRRRYKVSDTEDKCSVTVNMAIALTLEKQTPPLTSRLVGPWLSLSVGRWYFKLTPRTVSVCACPTGAPGAKCLGNISAAMV